LNDGDAPVDFSQSLVVCHLSNLSSPGEPTLAASRYHFQSSLCGPFRVMPAKAGIQ